MNKCNILVFILIMFGVFILLLDIIIVNVVLFDIIIILYVMSEIIEWVILGYVFVFGFVFILVG